MIIKFEHTEEEIIDYMQFFDCERAMAVSLLNTNKERLLKARSS